MNVAEMIVQNGEEHDQALHMKSAPVNIRLFKTNEHYRKVVMQAVDYMLTALYKKLNDYPRVQGISGANVGIPLNIVAVKTRSSSEVFLNPVIVDKSKEMEKARSNCGSLNLPKPITVERHVWVGIRYYDTEGKEHQRIYEIGDFNEVSSATLQHEIDHNLGILITDK